MKKAYELLKNLVPVANHKTFFTLLFSVVSKSEEVLMIPSKSGKSVNILNYPVSNTKELESDECIAKLISEIKNISGVSHMTNQSNEYDTPLLSICPISNKTSLEDKLAMFKEHLPVEEEATETEA
tara:strand:+ start:243 stop:620 length:378 start_codon:yes stop_codon:yes gene_type:complete